MEQNLSRALLMAAGMLVALLILALGAYLYTTFSARVKETARQNQVAVIQTYNSKFTKYDNRENLNIQDIVSIANLARQYNIDNGFEGVVDDTNSNFYIKVGISGVSSVPNLNNLETDVNFEYWKQYVNLIENSTLSNLQFKCQVTLSNVSGRVKSVIFSKI